MRSTPFVAMVLAFFAASPSPAADAPTLEERLLALEQRVQALEAENASLKAAAGAPVATPSAAPTPADAKPRAAATSVKVGGLLQVQAEAGGRPDSRFSDDNDRLHVRRARVSVSGRLRDDLEWRTELELAGSLQASPGMRAQLTDGYVHWRHRPAFEIRAGQFKTPYGHEQLVSDSKLALAERTLGSDRLTLGRQLGLQLGGSGSDGRFSWSAGAFNGTAANASGNDDDRFLLGARLTGVPATWRMGRQEARWTLGANGYESRDASVTLAPDFKFDSNPSVPGNDNVFAGRRRALGADTQLAIGRFELWSEWLQARFQPDDDLPSGDFDSRALAFQATMMAWKEKLQVVARWDEFDPNRSVADDSTETWTTGFTWLIKGHDLKLQANWIEANGPQPDGHENRLLIRLQAVF